MVAVAAGQKLRGSDLSNAASSSIQNDSGTVASATYVGARTGTSNVAGVAFTAPNSGNVMLWWSCGISATSQFAIASFEVRAGNVVGSGTVVVAASDNNVAQGVTTTETTATNFYPVSGLTAGASYNVRLMYRTQAGGVTGTFNRPRLAVTPLLA